MSSDVNASVLSSASDGASMLRPGFRRRAFDWLVAERVRITNIAFIFLVGLDLVTGVRPRDVTNLRDPSVALGLLLVIGGLAVRSWAAGTLNKCSEVTAAGPYSVIRNPLYFGSFLMMFGFCLLIAESLYVWFVLVPLAGVYLLKVLHEEAQLSAMFPEQWRSYAARVPRFLPRRIPTDYFSAWRRTQWTYNREYNAVMAAAAGLVALKLWQIALT